MKLRALLVATAAISALTASAAFAAEPESCKQPHFADVGWTDNTAQNGLLNTVLKGLGYKAKIDTLALPIILESLKAKQLDFFHEQFAKEVLKIGLDPAKPCLIYCALGGRAKRAAGVMAQAGFKEIVVLTDGFNAWKKAGKPVEGGR